MIDPPAFLWQNGLAEEPLGAFDEINFVHKVASALPDVLYVYDVLKGRTVYCNREIATMLGYSPNDIRDLGHNLFSHILDPDYIGAITEAHQKLALATDGTVVEVTYRMRHKDGSWRWLRSRDSVFARDGAGNVVQNLGVVLDITEERQAQQDLSEAVERYRSLVSILSDWVWEVDTDSVLTYVSPQAINALGYTPAELLGRVGYELMSASEGQFAAAVLAHATAAREPFFIPRLATTAKDGTIVYVEVTGTPIFHPHGEFRGFRGVNRDITSRCLLDMEREALAVEREALLAKERQRAMEDPLTKLLNRTAFESALEQHLPQKPTRSERGGPTTTSAILLLDLDNLKFFNDTYGHAAGDGVLVFVAKAIRSCCRSGDIIGRLSGDEFAVFLPGMARAGADARLRLIKDTVSRTGYQPPQRSGRSVDPIRISVSVSGGVAIMPQDGTKAHAAFEVADERLYADKTNEQLSWSESLKEELSASLPGFASLNALVTSVAAKDRYTLRHSEDILVYTLLIGEELGLPETELQALTVAALLHDVGKIGVPDRLLRLPGPLSPEEYETVKLHAALGASLTESAAPEIARQMPSVIPAVRHHHERWDGGEGGYPDRLAGEAIPFHARILAVADALSAMTTDRPYRTGLAIDEAKTRLRAGAGTQWDGRCVEALIGALEIDSSMIMAVPA